MIPNLATCETEREAVRPANCPPALRVAAPSAVTQRSHPIPATARHQPQGPALSFNRLPGPRETALRRPKTLCVLHASVTRSFRSSSLQHPSSPLLVNAHAAFKSTPQVNFREFLLSQTRLLSPLLAGPQPPTAERRLTVRAWRRIPAAPLTSGYESGARGFFHGAPGSSSIEWERHYLLHSAGVSTTR